MPSVIVSFTLAAPVEKVWDYVQRFENWAELMPGYQAAERIDDDTSVWTLKTDVGLFQRLVRLRARVTGRVPQTEITFQLEALEDPVSGEGTFRAQAMGGETEVHLVLAMQMSGMLAPVVNALFEKTLPRDVRTLAEGLQAGVTAMKGEKR